MGLFTSKTVRFGPVEFTDVDAIAAVAIICIVIGLPSIGLGLFVVWLLLRLYLARRRR